MDETVPPVCAGYPAEDDFHLRLYRAFHAQRTFLRAGHAQTGLGSGQPKLLDYIARHAACTQRDLARYYGLDAAGVCRMLDALERNGFIISSPDPADRRSKHLRITPAGTASLEVWHGHCAQLEDAMLAGFSSEERDQFASYLERAYLNLKDKAPRPVTAASNENAAFGEGAISDEGTAPTAAGKEVPHA